jgi:hypothetical protein
MARIARKIASLAITIRGRGGKMLLSVHQRGTTCTLEYQTKNGPKEWGKP